MPLQKTTASFMMRPFLHKMMFIDYSALRASSFALNSATCSEDSPISCKTDTASLCPFSSPSLWPTTRPSDFPYANPSVFPWAKPSFLPSANPISCSAIKSVTFFTSQLNSSSAKLINFTESSNLRKVSFCIIFSGTGSSLIVLILPPFVQISREKVFFSGCPQKKL